MPPPCLDLSLSTVRLALEAAAWAHAIGRPDVAALALAIAEEMSRDGRDRTPPRAAR